MTTYSDLLAVIVMLLVVALTPPALLLVMVILIARNRRTGQARGGAISLPAPPAASHDAVIDDFLQYSHGPWSYFHAGGLLMRAPRDEDGHVLLAQAHPARLDWCDDVTPVEILQILQSLEAHDRTRSAHGQAAR